MANVLGAVYEFGAFRLDTAKRLLTRDGAPVTIPPKTFDLLLLLVENRGRVLAKKELMEALWPQTFVEDANLSFQVSALRKALGGDAELGADVPPRVLRHGDDPSHPPGHPHLHPGEAVPAGLGQLLVAGPGRSDLEPLVDGDGVVDRGDHRQAGPFDTEQAVPEALVVGQIGRAHV